MRRNPIMQAPLRKGKKEETLGRAKGVKRTGRSLLFGIVLVAIVVASSLVYTSERLLVERMLKQNLAYEKKLETIQKRTDWVVYEVARLEAIEHLSQEARNLGMKPIEWQQVYVIVSAEEGAR